MSKRAKEHAFSIELKSKQYLKELILLNRVRTNVFIEGVLGELVKLCFVEDVMLEIAAINGTFRIDLRREEFAKLFLKGARAQKTVLQRDNNMMHD
ncbi:MAG: hypothetical protein JSV20_03925 [Candidatus Bathyarchaeota archaeon]|nr:MAG: hypothetical protein JSV20_03925 [Candidatus Bathyarchaeota archaeon]